MAIRLQYTVHLVPTTKKNSQQILTNRATGRPFIAQSSRYKQYEQAAGLYLRPKPAEPIDQPVQVKCLFYMPTRRRCDLTNLLEAIDDILVKHRVLADDNYKVVASHDGSRVFYDGARPRTEITITDYED